MKPVQNKLSFQRKDKYCAFIAQENTKFRLLLFQDGVFTLRFEQRPEPGLHHDVHFISGII